MVIVFKRLIAGFMVACALTIGAPAVRAQSSAAELAALPDKLPMGRGDIGHEQFMAEVLRPFEASDSDRNGLNAADINRSEQVAGVRRPPVVASVLKYDWNNDGKVTRDEVARAAAREVRNIGPKAETRIAELVARVMKADRNSDDTVTFAEMLVPEPDAGPTPASRAADQARALLALDPDKDGTLTRAEMVALAEAWFAVIDSNHDDFIDGLESTAYQRAHPLPAGLGERCVLPDAGPNDLIVLFGAYDGTAISSVSVGGPDIVTTTTRVTVEPGIQPVYLVLSAHTAMIWRVEGATERIRRVVLIARRGTSTGEPYAGVTGVPAEKVTFAASGRCQTLPYEVKMPGASALKSIGAQVGRSPDAYAGNYSAEGVDLPSGRIGSDPAAIPPPPGFDADIWRESLRYAPGGVKTIDPDSVVSAVPARPYDVLPQEAGLAQLVGQGDLVALYSDNHFRIARPIPRFPAGLGGAHSVNFLLSSGLPMPAGDPGHSCVYLEDAGETAGGSISCR